jgi:hypothetical protein
MTNSAQDEDCRNSVEKKDRKFTEELAGRGNSKCIGRS